MNYELIALTEWPSMPVPIQSKDPGEAWVWGDFFATLQKDPPLMCQHMQAILGKPVMKTPPMSYLYAMTVFYDKSKNPHGPSSRPVLCVGLEQADFDAMAKLPGGKEAILGDQRGKGPLVVGVFSASGRLNLGAYDGLVTAESARSHFFTVIRSLLALSGEPVQIGTINDIYGHPNTGWTSPRETVPTSSRKTWWLLIGLMALVAFLFWMLFFGY